ncbi:MAG: indole-3-glycerol-phosphate synthase [Nitrososphaerota archaeon]|nr:indole-3-glycerol-phosphate synthase [Nitrososphaerota archaeon]MDG6943186.1 indole-3-glycerol-phosphate synthase [Nitrososphaerota archaeon]MDG6950936.1 indole-3-glycerol-phosphate synthase [Nitrososphaerota archaeon]
MARLVRSARARVDDGYYDVREEKSLRRFSLAKSLRREDRIPIIAEVKFRSPADGKLTAQRDVGELAKAYERGGAAGISVLTEPEHFDGRLEYIPAVKKAVGVPVLMKDVIVDGVQVEAACRLGADAVLLIAGVFRNEYAAARMESMLANVHSMGMEALVEAHDETELAIALSSDADVVGINNRNLGDLSVSLDTSRRLLRKGPFAKPVICESGISSRDQVESLVALGADGFLVGSALMKSNDLAGSIRALSGMKE